MTVPSADTASRRRVARRVRDIDVIIGQNLRRLRIAKGFSQTQVAEHIGVSYQQEHKWERGINRMAGSRIWMAAEALDVVVQRMFDGCGDGGAIEAMDSKRSKAMLRAVAVLSDLSDDHLDAVTVVARKLREGQQ